MRRGLFALLSALTLLLTAGPGCYDEAGACMDYCRQAAACLTCPYTDDSLKRCQQECMDLSISEQKKLPRCTDECSNYFACDDLVGFTAPRPCDY
ncbi:MAG: hypothetical protein ABI333_28515 [bacterium]